MGLTAGRMLLHYEVVGPLGAGGMGEVYRARDTRLERDVALKVLPDGLVENAEHLSRFEREAKLLAALNHPNVATIHGLDQVDAIHFLVLELVPGETLGDRLRPGPLPVEEAVHVARQVAAGLQAAHETGIVHRDLKPANIIVRPDGVVKILDFGLAKQTEVEQELADQPLTQAFQVVGTPGYLSPEQARGEEAGRRADVWAFGCILFECLVGARAFPGKTVGESIRALFEDTPDFESLPPETPPTVHLLISRCLSKDSATRLRNIGDVKLLLEGALDPSMASGTIVIKQAAPKNRGLIVGLAAAVGTVAVMAFFLLKGTGEAPTFPKGTQTLTLPFGSELGWRQTSANLSKLGSGSPLLAISRDGRRVAYCAKDGEDSAIYMHVAGKRDARKLPHTKFGRGPFFSPDGNWVGFHADNKLKIVPSEAEGDADEICEVLSPNFAACYTPDGKGIFYSTRKGLWFVDLATRKPILRTKPRKDEVEHFGPTVLPGGKHVLFTVTTGTKAHVAMLTRATKDWVTVVPSGTSPRFAGGHLWYAHASSLRKLPFDPAAPAGGGIAQPVGERVYSTAGAGGGLAIPHFDVSEDGTLALAPPTEEETRSAAIWVARVSEGKGVQIDVHKGNWKHPRIAPNSRRFAVDILDASGTKDVWVWDEAFHRWTDDGMSVNSCWAPDGTLCVRSTHHPKLRVISAPGARPVELPIKLDGVLYADSWSSDSETLVVTQRKLTRTWIWTFNRRTEELKGPLNNARYGQISPDDKWLAYVIDGRNQPEVWLRRYPDMEAPVRIAPGGEPVWSKNGNELFYRRQDGEMRVVDLRVKPVSDKRLFANKYDPEVGGHQHYDVSSEGDFLMIRNDVVAPVRILVVR